MVRYCQIPHCKMEELLYAGSFSLLSIPSQEVKSTFTQMSLLDHHSFILLFSFQMEKKKKKRNEKDNHNKLLKASQIFLQKENVMFFTEIVFKYQQSGIKKICKITYFFNIPPFFYSRVIIILNTKQKFNCNITNSVHP